MGFNFQIFEFGGGGSGSGSGIAKYPTAAALPATAADGDVAIVLDTNNLYSYDTGVPGWVIIGGPGIAISVADSNSVDLTLTLNVLTADVRYAGATAVANFSGMTLQTLGGATPGIFALVPGFRIGEVTSGVLQFSGNSFPVLGTSFGIQVNQASGATSGYLSTTDWNTFNNKVGISAILQTVFPILGGTNIPSSGGITLSIPVANGTTGGYLSATDWTTFNNKLGTGATIGQLGNIAANTFLGNNTGGAGPILALTIAQTKAALGITLNNFGDVSLGAFLAATSAVGATISAAQVLSFTEAQTTNPGMVSASDQSWNGIKYFNSVAIGWSGFGITKPGGPDTMYLNCPANYSGSVNYFWPPSVGITFGVMSNDGTGIMTWKQSNTMNGYRSVSAGATLNLQDRVIEVTTGATDRTLNVGWATGQTGVNFTVLKIDSGLGAVILQSDRLINGVTNFVFSTQWESHKLVDNGVGLRVIS